MWNGESSNHLASDSVMHMATALPPGETVDSIFLSLPWDTPVLTTEALPPLCTNISAAVVNSFVTTAGQHEPEDVAAWVPAALAGLRQPEAVRALAERATEPWMVWAVQMNSLHDPGVHRLPEFAVPPLRPGESMLRVPQLLPSALSYLQAPPERGSITAEVLRRGPSTMGDYLAELWPWGRAPFNPKVLPQGVSASWRFSTHDRHLYENVRLDELSRYGDPGLVRTSGYMDALAADSSAARAQWVADEMVRADLVGILPDAYLAPWVEKALLHPDAILWQALLGNHAVQPVAGEILGRKLVERVGSDTGAWSLALELLGDWDQPLPVFLDTLASVVRGRGPTGTVTA